MNCLNLSLKVNTCETHVRSSTDLSQFKIKAIQVSYYGFELGLLRPGSIYGDQVIFLSTGEKFKIKKLVSNKAYSIQREHSSWLQF